MFNASTLNQVDLNSPVTGVLTFTVAKNPVTQPTFPWSGSTQPTISWSKSTQPTVAWSKSTDPTTVWTPPTGSLWALNGIPMDGSAAFGGRQIGLVSWSKASEPTTPWT